MESVVEMYRRTYAEVNLDHIAHNFEVLKKAFPEAPFICPMVKANAYGHGDVAVARCLESVGAKHLGVCLLEEGIQLRQGGVKADILVFRGFGPEDVGVLLSHKLTPVVATWAQFEAVEKAAGSAVQIHLKFNTGMNRLGFPVTEAQKLFERCWQNPKVRVQGILTHLYNGEDAQDPQGHSAQQLQALEKIISVFKPLNPIVHALNSSGILNAALVREQKKSDHILTRVNWGLRPGLMIYGYHSLPQSPLKLKQAMVLKSVSATYRQVNPGEVVSYGGTWTAKRPSIISVIPIGYADGYHRILSNKARALFRGQAVPVIGTVCMDFIMVDITDVVKGENFADLKESEVILFGSHEQGVSADELAKHAQTISYEILTSVGARVPRVFSGAWSEKLGVQG